jgi:hypothetical protein
VGNKGCTELSTGENGMKVRGVLLENEQGDEFLVTLRDETTAGRPAFIVERRERGIWVSANLPARQSVAITALGLMGLSAVAERCGLKLTGNPPVNEEPFNVCSDLPQ